jgi:hypothetical protein
MFGIDGDVAYRNGFGPLKDSLPGNAAVIGFEEAARTSGGVEKARVAWDAFDAGDAPYHSGGSDAAPFELIQELQRILRIGCLGSGDRD